MGAFYKNPGNWRAERDYARISFGTMTKSLASNTNLVVIEAKLPPKAETHKMLTNALRIIRTSESLPMNSKSKISWHLWVFIDSEFQR